MPVLVATLALPAAALADHAGPLAAQWHLDVRQGGENQTTPDSSGHGLDASNDLSDALSIAPGGRFGNHLATTPGAVSPAASALLRPQQVTLFGWVRASGPQGILKYVAGQGAEDSPGCGGSSYALYTGTAAGDGLRFYIRPAVGNAQVSPPAGNGIWDNQWHMVAGVGTGHGSGSMSMACRRARGLRRRAPRSTTALRSTGSS